MKLIRLKTLTHTEAVKIRKRQKAGTMKEYFDDEDYLCFDEIECENYKPKKRGRKVKGGYLQNDFE